MTSVISNQAKADNQVEKPADHLGDVTTPVGHVHTIAAISVTVWQLLSRSRLEPTVMIGFRVSNGVYGWGLGI